MNRLIAAWFITCVMANVAAGFLDSTSWISWKWEEVILAVWIGFVGAQIGVHAIWSVFAPWSLVSRLLFSVATGLALALAYVCSEALRWGYAYIDGEELLGFLLCLPLVSLVIQLPLWLARIWLTGGFVSADGPSPEISKRSLNIRDLMLFTAVVAVTFAAARLASRDYGRSAPEFLVELLIQAGVAAVICLFSVLPTVIATHLARRGPWAAAVAILFETAAYVILIVVLSLIGGSPPPRDMYWIFAVVFVSFVVFLTTPLLISRRLGYRLVRYKRGVRG